MHFLEYYYENVVKYDLLNKFCYKASNQIPQIKKIVLNFGCNSSDLKNLTPALLALELITIQKGILTKTKNSNVLIKIRKGNPIGCKVTLHKITMYTFFAKLLIEIFPKLKNFKGFYYKITLSENNAISYRLNNMLTFFELEKNYHFFKTLPNLNITVVTNSKTQKEFLYLINSFKLPVCIS